MITQIRRLGSARVVTIPKPMLQKAGLEKEVEVVLRRGLIVLRKPRRNPRQGWAEASRRIAEAGEDNLMWLEVTNLDDADLKW